MTLCQGTAPEVAISGLSRFSRGYGSWKSGRCSECAKDCGGFPWGDFAGGDAGMVLVVVVLVLGLLGRKWWMDGGG